MHPCNDSQRRARLPNLVSMAIVLPALLLAACSAGTSSPSAAASGPTTVNVKLTEFKVELSQTAIPPGDVKFSVTNNGSIAHEFVVFQTDLAADKLPMASADRVDEAGAGVDPLGEVEDVEPGTTKQFTIKLEPGSYVGVCNVDGHYKRGMSVAITVS